MPRSLRHDRAHDYPHLIRRWRALARRAGLKMAKYVNAAGYDLYFLESPKATQAAPAVYLSAGIHGDEVAATEGLLLWAEKNVSVLRALHVLIFPCLNPWGLAGNSRMDAEGRDLNRGYNRTDVPQISAQMKLMAGRRFDLGLTLHEDYDAQGLYIYEVPSRPRYWAEAMVKAAAKNIPADLRRKIEGRSARGGVVRRAIKPDLMPDWPEAFVLHFHHAARTFTVETPSEFSLDDRVAAQVAMITMAVALCRKEFSLLKAGGQA